MEVMFLAVAILYCCNIFLLQQAKGQSRLADAAAHGAGQGFFEQHTVIRQLFAVYGIPDAELFAQGRGIHPYAHRRDLHRPLQHRVPEQQVAVKSAAAGRCFRAPVIIIGRPAVVHLPVGQGMADTGNEYGAVFAGRQVFPFFGCFTGITFPQRFCMDKDGLRGQGGGGTGKGRL